MNSSAKHLWLISLSAVFLFILLFVGSGSSDEWRVFREARQFGHVALFALVGYRICYNRLLLNRSFLFRCLIIFAVGIILGTITEWIQLLIGRDFDGFDIVRDVIGCFVGFSIYVAVTEPRLRTSFIVSSLILVGIGGKDLWICMADELDMAENHSVLGDFETLFQWTRWQPVAATLSLSNQHSFAGQYSLQVDLKPARFSGATLTEFYSDWSGYDELHLHLYLEDDSREFQIKIYDRWHRQKGYQSHDRFNRTVKLTPGWNTIVIPIRELLYAPDDRVMNLTQIAAVEIFTADLNYPLRIYLDELKLLNRSDNLRH